LATHLAQRHFKTVHIVTSTWGAKILKHAGVPHTEMTTELDIMKKASSWFWAYGKLLAYNLQTEPFVHVDNDVFLWKPLPDRVLNADLCFQSKEFLSIPNYKWYDVLKPCWNAAPTRPQAIIDNEITDFVYNCGICGGHNLGFFKQWIGCSAEYIFAPDNQALFFETYKDILMHQNLFHEQYFAAALIKANNLRDRVQVITDDAENLVRDSNNGYTHLWGGCKTDQQGVMRKVKARLLKECPELYARVDSFVNNYLFECPKDATKILV
jgi:hypothetical protein